MKAVLRRSRGIVAETVINNIGENRIDVQSARVYRNGNEVILTAMEYKLLLILLKNRGQILPRQKILDLLWDDAGGYVNDNTLTVYIKRLRSKLEDSDGYYIETVRGLGYRLNR